MFSQTISEANVSSGVNVSEDDTRLIARSRAGDMAAFEQIYRNYERPVFRHALYLLGSREDADDVKQETFLRAYRMLASFRNDCDLQTWLYKICTTSVTICCAASSVGRRSRSIPKASRAIWPRMMSVATPPCWPNARRRWTPCSRYSRGCPCPSGHVITLYLLEGFDYARIAEILGCARGSAKMRVLRGMEQYRERVASFLQEPAGGKVGGKDHV